MTLEMFGSHVFTPAQMQRYLSPAQLKQVGSGTISMETANAVADAMRRWAMALGATHYCHWFQPLTGATAEKHESFLSGQADGQPLLSLTGKQLIRGESDASSFPTGGLRGTAYARGYTAWDMTSPVFVKEEAAGKILCIPTVFLSQDGTALDLKTPLLRAMEALAQQGSRFTGLFGKPQRVYALVGPEQEYFLIDRKVWTQRRDLRHCGRTLFGAPAPKSQELDDQYFCAIGQRAGQFMQALNRQLWKMGVMAAAQHREAAPAQHELAVRHCRANVAVDQNQLVMQTMRRVARQQDLVCLLHEKPFAGVNGSGKHNNWSLCTEDGENLFKAGADARFLLALSCVLQAVDRHGDLLRLSAANVGNDARLGGQEAPTAVVSVYLGDPLQQLLEIGGNMGQQTMDPGLAAVPSFCHDRADRNRTAAMAFTGDKFEFRMVGASDSVAMANTVLFCAVAESFSEAADALQGAQDMEKASRAYAKMLWQQHRRIVFNGDCYSHQWAKEARARGLPAAESMAQAVDALKTEKAAALFGRFGVFSPRELASRAEVLYEQYARSIHVEARIMLDMAARDYIPSVIRYLAMLDRQAPVQRELYATVSAHLQTLQTQLHQLQTSADAAARFTDGAQIAQAFRENVVPAMLSLRRTVDTLETMVDRRIWPVPSYADLLFSL